MPNLPSWLPAYTAHESNAICQDASKSTCQRSHSEEKRDTVLSFGSLIPHAEVEHDAREQSTLGHSKEKSHNEEARHATSAAVIHDDTLQRGYYAPDKGDERQPYPRPDSLEYNVP